MGTKTPPDTDEALREWRAKAVRFVLIVLAVSGLLSWGSVVNNDLVLTGLTPISWAYIVIYLAIIVLALVPRVDYRVRVWGLVVLSYLNAVASFARLGLVGSGRLYLLSTPIIAALLVGWRTGIVTTALSLAVYFTIAPLASLGQFGEWHRLLENPTLLDRWGESGMALVTFLFTVMVMVESFQRLMQRTLAARQETGRALVQTAGTLQRRLDYEQLITNISTEFINLGPTEIDAGIHHALEAISKFAGADRSYIFQFSEDQTRMDNTHEWCAAGVEPQSQRIQGQSTSVTPWTIERIKRLEAVKVPRVAGLPAEARLDQVEFQAQSIQSLICIPMVYRGEAIGFIGFDAVQRERDWPEDDAALLRVVGEIIVNALEVKRAQAIAEGQRKFLELLATGRSISEILHALVGLIEEQWPGMLGLVLLLDEDGRRLHIGASASLPKEYVDSIEGLEIGPEVGSCGTACYTRQRVIVEDIATDPRWKGLRSLGLKYGLRACWSEPVFSESGQVVGTFAMYYRQPRTPSKAELRTIETAAHLVGVAVEHERAEQARQAALLEERSRLARELHDSVTQSLYSVTLYAEAAARLFAAGDTQTAVEHLHELRDTSKDALREMRLLIYELRPPVLGTGGLAGALQARLDAVEARAGLRTELEVEGIERLPYPVQEELYYIAREALNNLLKHAKARSVNIHLAFRDTLTLLEVCDDGVGFDPDEIQASGGLGIFGMRERAQRIGARLEIRSAPAAGTTVRVVAAVNGGG